MNFSTNPFACIHEFAETPLNKSILILPTEFSPGIPSRILLGAHQQLLQEFKNYSRFTNNSVKIHEVMIYSIRDI